MKNKAFSSTRLHYLLLHRVAVITHWFGILELVDLIHNMRNQILYGSKASFEQLIKKKKNLPNIFIVFLKNLPHHVSHSTSRKTIITQIWGSTTIKEATSTQFSTYILEFHNVFFLLIKDENHIMIEQSVRIIMLLTSKKWIKKHFMSC